MQNVIKHSMNETGNYQNYDDQENKLTKNNARAYTTINYSINS